MSLARKLATQYSVRISSHLRQTDNLQTELGVEVLLVELKEQKNRRHSDRIAEAFVFDYSTGQSFLHLLNLDTGKRISTRSIASAHLPLNQNEIDFVLTRVLTDRSVRLELQLEYQQQFVTLNPELTALDMKVSVWLPTDSDDPCVRSRCALVSVFTDQHYNFSVEPVVDLITGRVRSNLLQPE